MNLIDFFFVVSLASVAIWIVLHKWGFLDWYQFKRRKWMPIDCNFCFFFWLAFLQFQIYNIANNGAFLFNLNSLLIYPACASVLSLTFKPKFKND